MEEGREGEEAEGARRRKGGRLLQNETIFLTDSPLSGSE